MSRPYEGPFDAPPAELTKGAVGWRFTKMHVSESRWEPKGWEIVYPDHVVEFNLAGVAVRDSTLHPVPGQTAVEALERIHRDLYPERYGYNAEHAYWDDFDPDAEDAFEVIYKHDREPYQWDAGTIEWVADAIASVLVELGVDVPKP